MGRMSAEFCVNYHGLYQKTHCEAGVAYADVEREKLPDDTSRLDRMPCFEREPCLSVPCAARRFPTPEERAERDRLSRESTIKFFAKIEQGICPDCDRTMIKRQVGSGVYAAPCGHRLYQGKV